MTSIEFERKVLSKVKHRFRKIIGKSRFSLHQQLDRTLYISAEQRCNDSTWLSTESFSLEVLHLLKLLAYNLP